MAEPPVEPKQTWYFYDIACRGGRPQLVELPDQFLAVEPRGDRGLVWLYVHSEEHGDSQHILLDRPALRSLATLLNALAEEPDHGPR